MNLENLQYAGSGGGGGSSPPSPAESAGIIVYVPGTRRTLSKPEVPGKVLIGTNCRYDSFGYGSVTGIDEPQYKDEAKTVPLLDDDGNPKVIKAKTVREFVEGINKTGFDRDYKDEMLRRLVSEISGIDLDENLITESKRLSVDLFNIVLEMLPEMFLNASVRDQFHLLDKKTGFAIAERGRKSGFPKGGQIPEDKGDLLVTAKREFKEETGFDLDTIPELEFIPVNPGAVKGQYLFFLVVIKEDVSKQIIEAFEGRSVPVASAGGGAYVPPALMPKSGGHRYNSELFDLKFTNQPINLDRAHDELGLNLCLANGSIKLTASESWGSSKKVVKDLTPEEYAEYKTANPGKTLTDYLNFKKVPENQHFKFQFKGGQLSYQQKFQKYQQKLLNN
jgi:hypothetical protein